MNRGFFSHLGFFFRGRTSSAPTGSATDLQNKLNDIANALPNIFATAGDATTNLNNVELTNIGNAATNLATVTGELDTANEELEKLQAWKANETVLLKIIEERKKLLEETLKNETEENKKDELKDEIKEIDILFGEVTGLTKAKEKLIKEFEDWIAKYSHDGSEPLVEDTFKISYRANVISGGDGTTGHHWGNSTRKGPKGEGWKDYIEGAIALGSGSELHLDEVKSNIKMGMLEAVFPEILRKYHSRDITKKTIEKFMNDNPYPGFWDSKDDNPKSLDEIKDIDNTNSTNYANMTMKDIVAALARPAKNVTDWGDVLTEISDFFTHKKPTTLQAIKDFLEEENYPDPLDGVNLGGKPHTELKTTFNSREEDAVNNELTNAQDYAATYQGYTALQSSKDGNCFLNSFSILINGDEDLATRLRVVLCLVLMSGKYVDGSEADKVNEITEKLTNRTVDSQSCALAKPGDWLAGDDIAYMVGVLNRPITLIYKPNTSGWDKNGDAYKEVEKTGGFAVVEYPATGLNPFGAPSITGMTKPSKTTKWVIYHVNNNHFVPLIKN